MTVTRVVGIVAIVPSVGRSSERAVRSRENVVLGACQPRGFFTRMLTNLYTCVKQTEQ